MKTSKKYRGSILAMVLVIVILLAIVGTAMLMLGQGTRIFAARNVADISARLAADAGITKAMHAMNDKLLGLLNSGATSWDDGSLPSVTDEAMDNAYSKFSFVVDPCVNDNKMGDGFLVTSNGTCSNRQRNVYATIGPESTWKGIAVENLITLKRGATFNTIPVSGGDITLRTNTIGQNDIRINQDVTFEGDVEVIVGPGGNADAVITGQSEDEVTSSYAAIDSIIFNPVTVPSGFPSSSNALDKPAGDVNISTGGKYTYSTINLDRNLIINSPVEMYVVGQVILNNGSSIKITTNGKLVLYLGNSLEAKYGSQIINQQNNATYLEVYGTNTCESIILKNSSDFYGVVYAPQANLSVYNSGDIYGAFVGKTFELKENANFFYDTRVYDPNELGYNISFAIKYWSED